MNPQPSKLVAAIEESYGHAAKAMYDRDLVNRILAEASHVATHNEKLAKTLPPLLGLIRAYFNGEWRKCELDDIQWALAAALYVVSPWDLIPDYLPTGLRDDEQVAQWVTDRIDETVAGYNEWARLMEKRRRATQFMKSAGDGAVS